METFKKFSVAEIIKSLNGVAGDDWVPIEGTFSLTEVSTPKEKFIFSSFRNNTLTNHQNFFNPHNKFLTFDPNQGLVVKVFYNRNTGEIRNFLAKDISDLPENMFLQ